MDCAEQHSCPFVYYCYCPCFVMLMPSLILQTCFLPLLSSKFFIIKILPGFLLSTPD